MHDARGFHIEADGNFNQNSVQFAYMCIRQRGPKICKTVDDGALGSDYYAAGTGTNQANCPPGCFLSGPDDASAETWPVDFGLVKEQGGNGNWNACTRDRWTYYWRTDDSDRGDNNHYSGKRVSVPPIPFVAEAASQAGNSDTFAGLGEAVKKR